MKTNDITVRSGCCRYGAFDRNKTSKFSISAIWEQHLGISSIDWLHHLFGSFHLSTQQLCSKLLPKAHQQRESSTWARHSAHVEEQWQQTNTTMSCVLAWEQKWIVGNWADKVKFHQAGSLNYHNWRPRRWGGIWQPVQNVILWTPSAQTIEVMCDYAWLSEPADEPGGEVEESKSGIRFLFFVVNFLFEEKRKDTRVPPP